jgi:hypothetical protein
MWNPTPYLLAVVVRLRQSARLLLRFIVAATGVTALALSCILLLRVIVFDAALDEPRACALAKEHVSARGLLPARCGRFGTTDSVGSICVYDSRGKPIFHAMLFGGALPFEEWHVDKSWGTGDSTVTSHEFARGMCSPE